MSGPGRLIHPQEDADRVGAFLVLAFVGQLETFVRPGPAMLRRIGVSDQVLAFLVLPQGVEEIDDLGQGRRVALRHRPAQPGWSPLATGARTRLPHSVQEPS